MATGFEELDVLSIGAVRDAYLRDHLTPAQLLAELDRRNEQYESHNIWIYRLSDKELTPYIEGLKEKDPETHSLWGVPFAIKDNIDLAGVPTTAACPEFSYMPRESATVVQKLIDAGAIPIGKTNLDQFATGLNGTRSPYGECRNAFNADYISGGSSAGSAVSVALGLVSFSLGTDTAGSGRVPACFNNLIGVKPTRGLLSAKGMLPACKSLDCMTVFALHANDANTVLSVAEGFDFGDAYSKKNTYANSARQFGSHEGELKVGVIKPEQLQFFGSSAYQQAYAQTVETLDQGIADHCRIEWVEIDYTPFDEAAKLLYEGPWVAERYLATQPLIDDNPDAVFPVVRGIIEQGKQPKASELFKAQYRLRALKQVCDAAIEKVDCLLLPTAGCCFTIKEMLDQPVLRNSQLGHYTNFMNLLDYAAVAVPTQIASNGLPFGITLVADAFSDRKLLSIANGFSNLFDLPLGASDMREKKSVRAGVSDLNQVDVLVCGAHLSGLPLNWQLVERGAKLKTATKTASQYRMYALAGGPPFRPGLILDKQKGKAIDVEVWLMPMSEFGSFVNGIPAPLGIGKVELADGSHVSGFICEPYGVEGAEEITELGGWKKYLQQKNSA